jgi:hypothetical protein
VAGGDGADDFGGRKIARRAYQCDQVTVAVAGGTAADVHPSGAAWISNIACGTSEVLDFVRYVAGGRVVGQPLDMSTQKSRERGEVPGRGLKLAFVRDQARPGS